MDGWLPCDGRELAISEYPDLFSMVGSAWGGDREKKTFNLPDLTERGSFIIRVRADDKYPAGMIIQVLRGTSWTS